MSKDHYVAKIYLRQFADAGGMLHGVKKSDQEAFPCHPDDVCRELDGDTIRDFLSVPDALGQYRKMFEPRWGAAVAAIGDRTASPDIKFAISGYWANLMVCTPGWRRVAIGIHNQNLYHQLQARNILLARHGKPNFILQNGLEKIASGKLQIDVEPDYIRALAAKHVIKYAWGLYNADWRVFENDTELPFVTSDNPVAIEDRGPWRGGVPPFIRYLPITPQLCLMCDLSTKFKDDAYDKQPDFSCSPEGKIKGGKIGIELVRRINVAVAKCAETMLLSHENNVYLRDLAKSYATYLVIPEAMMIPTAEGFIIGNYIRALDIAA